MEAISGGGTDMAAVKQLLDTSLKPLIDARNEEADTQAVNAKALEIYNDFTAQHPDAAIHENSLARLLKQEPSLSPEAAYWKLRSYYTERNLDWTKPLEQLQKEQQLNPSANTQQWCDLSNSAPIRLLRYSLDSRWSFRSGCSLTTLNCN